MSKKLNILYVEDHELSRNTITKALEYLEFTDIVHTASNGVEALELYLKNKDYDILITDINMPQKGGLELIKEIKDHKDIFSIITTAFDDKNFLQEAIDSQVNKYLLKPLNLISLIEIIEKYYKNKIEKYKIEYRKELQIANSRLTSLEEVIDNIAHQWRQPLNLIAMKSSYLSINNDLDNLTKQDLKESLDIIKKTTLDLSDTLNNLNHVIQESRDYETKNLLEKIKEISSKIKEENNHINLNFEFEIDENLDLKTLWDDLSLVFKDLFTNSIDQFVEKKIKNPTIKVIVYIDDKSMLIKIIDNAQGIEKDILPRIFEPYCTTKFKSKDKGLGLYVCYKIVNELLNGNLYVKNEDDGAVFTIKLNVI